ncbi:MAG: hypothetical protein GY768_18275 [Planctomycetaceae bacterium]|nr:hypothetical protein [Planctomycetaceae bacterium]
MRSLLIALTLLAAPVAAQDQTSTKEDFKEFTQAMSGRFRSEIKLIYDWPGHENKRGDVIQGIRFGRKIADGQGLLCTNVVGTGIDTEMFTYDAAAKQIVVNGVASGGGTWRTVVWKESRNKWNWDSKGSLVNGENVTGNGYWKIEDGGKKIHFISDSLLIGKTKTDPLHDKFFRVN